MKFKDLFYDATQQGIGARWFSCPWFDPLPTSPEFQGVLAAAP